MSNVQVTVGQILKGNNGLYKIVEALKTNTVFKAAILGSTSQEIPRGARQFAVVKTETDESMKYVFNHVNPNNILLSNIDSAYPIVKVGDLGNMLREGYDDSRIQSLPTRAPEVWRGLGCFHSSDVWSIGATLTYWLAEGVVFGTGDKIIDDNTEAWCIAKIIRLVGPMPSPVNEAFRDEFSLARALEKEEYEDPETGEMKRFITVGTVRQELEKIEGVPRDLIEFIEYLLVIDHTKRPTAREVLRHPYLADLEA
ncbi:hypothetical protein V502_11164 [Pseudogymnoascus sp. VKM F-4520 (FW-2644)]|nr:hypothetical protein V502_11164 [Pseudogymnoascus sp. VKM F-4520 (FW-2644)]